MDPVRARALELRRAGWSVPDIAAELGVAKSTAYLWVRHLPYEVDSDRARRKRAGAKALTDAYWDARRAARDTQRTVVQEAEADKVGALSDREVLLLGAAIYWCEGAKSKPWRRGDERLKFINRDPGLLTLFLRYLALLGVTRIGFGSAFRSTKRPIRMPPRPGGPNVSAYRRIVSNGPLSNVTSHRPTGTTPATTTTAAWWSGFWRAGSSIGWTGR